MLHTSSKTIRKIIDVRNTAADPLKRIMDILFLNCADCGYKYPVCNLIGTVLIKLN